MTKCRKVPASIASVIGFAFASFSLFAACGDPADSTLLVEETNALGVCTNDAGCAPPEEPASEAGWLSRCTSDAECEIGACVCGLCTRACSTASSVCSGVPEVASCFAGRNIVRAALCHATTVPGICLQACNSSDECGEGFSCALGACLPKPAEHPAASLDE